MGIIFLWEYYFKVSVYHISHYQVCENEIFTNNNKFAVIKVWIQFQKTFINKVVLYFPNHYLYIFYISKV